MAAFILYLVLAYRKRQNQFQQSLEQIKLEHDRTLLSSKLEMQEQTFQHISREIHDNINLSLTLAKLQLNTFDWNDKPASEQKMKTSIELLSKSIAELSDISKGLNADIIIQQGLIRALEYEIDRIRQTGLFTIDFNLTGEPVYMDTQRELIIFRIIQEAFNNIIKHARAAKTGLHMHYDLQLLTITITDDGVGFDTQLSGKSREAGLKNMMTRTTMLGGEMDINTRPGQGTALNFTIPILPNHD